MYYITIISVIQIIQCVPPTRRLPQPLCHYITKGKHGGRPLSRIYYYIGLGDLFRPVSIIIVLSFLASAAYSCILFLSSWKYNQWTVKIIIISYRGRRFNSKRCKRQWIMFFFLLFNVDIPAWDDNNFEFPND
jgi:hypothetical protein